MTTLSAIDATPSITFSGAGLPSTSTIGASLDDVYLNTTTGESFRCHDATFGAQIWQGDKGTREPWDITAFDHPNLVAAYTMDNIAGATLNDDSPNGNNGTITGGAAVPGIIGNAYDFNGVSGGSEKIDIGTFYESTINSGTFSICGWVNIEQGVSFVISSTPSDTQDKGIYTAANADGSMTFSLKNAGVSTFVMTAAAGSVPVTGWHFLVFDCTGTTAEGFVDNSSVGSTASFTAFPTGAHTRNLYLASYNYTTPASSDGLLDQVRLFNRPLTADERTALYNSGAGA